MGEIELRDYQRECVAAIDALDGGSHLVQMATGLGKTVTFSRIARPGRMLVISHRDELVYQPVKYFDCEVGIEKGPESSHGEEVVSTSLQTLARRLESTFRPGEFDIIVTDEAHHALAESYRRVYDYLEPRLHVGFTATPRRGDDRGLSPVFDDIVFTRDLRWGIANGYLCDIDCRRVRVDWSTSGVRTRDGDFTASTSATSPRVPKAPSTAPSWSLETASARSMTPRPDGSSRPRGSMRSRSATGSPGSSGTTARGCSSATAGA